MHVIDARNVCEALPIGLRYLNEHGQREDSRAGPVIVAPGPVTTVYRRPTERVLFSAVRDANPFFHLMESIWMLAGRRDAVFLNNFVADFGARFAESASGRSNAEAGGHVHGAYGHRWRAAFGFDQLDCVVEKLRKNPQDRQCVIQMWDATPDHMAGDLTWPYLRGCDDLRGEWKDRPCNLVACLRVRNVLPPTTDDNSADNELRVVYGSDKVLDISVFCRSNDVIWGCLSGDTLIQSPEGDLPIRSLAARFKLGLKKWPVYAVDVNTGDMAIKWCTAAWRTGKKPVRELCFDDGTKLRLTGDHVLYRKKTARGVQSTAKTCIVAVKAGDLKVGDRIWAPALFKRGNRRVMKRNILKNTSFKNSHLVYRAYDEFLNGPLPRGYHLHHKDENILNDSKANLERLTASDHMSKHMTDKLSRMTPRQRSELAKKGSLAAAEAYEKLSKKERQAFNARRSANAAESRKKYWLTVSPEERSRLGKILSIAASKVVSREQLCRWARKGSRNRWKDPEQHKRQSELMKRLNAEGRLRANHKIVKIRELPAEDVYDFTVQGFHTALISNGVLAHNCYGANAVHFSVLLEYLAARIGVGVGVYEQISANYHCYEGELRRLRERADKLHGEKSAGCSLADLMDENRYAAGTAAPAPLVDDHFIFDHEVLKVLHAYESDQLDNEAVLNLRNRFLSTTVLPMLRAHRAYKNKFGHEAIEIARTIEAPDWRGACTEWLERRWRRA